MVFSDGALVARDGMMVALGERQAREDWSTLGKCDVSWADVRFDIPAKSDRIRVIGSQKDQLITEHRVLCTKVVSGRAVADTSRDVLKMAVIERHRRSGNMGIGFIQGFGFKRGAIAGTVAHDHHNLVTIGTDDASMLAASHAAAENGGGLAVAVGENILARLALPIGGLMSDQPVADVAASYARLIERARDWDRN